MRRLSTACVSVRVSVVVVGEIEGRQASPAVPCQSFMTQHSEKQRRARWTGLREETDSHRQCFWISAFVWFQISQGGANECSKTYKNILCVFKLHSLNSTSLTLNKWQKDNNVLLHCFTPSLSLSLSPHPPPKPIPSPWAHLRAPSSLIFPHGWPSSPMSQRMGGCVAAWQAVRETPESREHVVTGTGAGVEGGGHWLWKASFSPHCEIEAELAQRPRRR